MKTYHFTSDAFAGLVVFTFDDQGYLTQYDMTEATLTEEQKVYLLKRLPRHLEEIKQVLGQSKTAKLQLQKKAAVTFDMFWNRYDEKSRSSKKKCKAIWNRFSQAKRDRAYNYIDTYERDIPYGVAKKYAETYLRAELWEN